jgi:surfeit locus 1 family protein
VTGTPGSHVTDHGWVGAPFQSRRRDARRTLSSILLIMVGVVGIVAFSALGIWQLERLVWKENLISRVEQRIHAAPVPIPAMEEWASVDPDTLAYRRVMVRGHFEHERETLVQAVTERGAGFWVLTPLRTDAGAVVLVNRGFVPPEKRSAATRREGNPAGEISVTGLLRPTEPKGGFLRTNDPSADRWYSRDVAAIAAARGFSRAAPFFIDADATPNAGEWPAGGMTVVVFRNHHLVYAVTWFALALMSGWAVLFVVWRRPKTQPI